MNNSQDDDENRRIHTVLSMDCGFPRARGIMGRAAECVDLPGKWAASRNLFFFLPKFSNFSKYASKEMYLFDSLVPATRLNSK